MLPPTTGLGVSADVVICGQGPAGRALAHRCLTRGMRVTVVDPAPRRRWTATYAAWADEMPAWLDDTVIAARIDHPVAWGHRRHVLDRTYCVLDTGLLQDALGVEEAVVVAERAVRLTRHTVTTSSGRELRAGHVVDARGLTRSPRRAEQTAFGVVVPGDPGSGQLFMDWRADNGAEPSAPRSFLYVVALGDGTTLFEETCLAGRPALGLRELRARLEYRLTARGIARTGGERVERVRFPVQGGRPGRYRFGAAGGFLHPATGYSVAATLNAADEFATSVAADHRHRATGPFAAIAPSLLGRARTVHAMRIAGLRAVLALPPADLPAFFDTFFDLPAHLQRAYLSGRTDPAGTAAAMRALFAATPPATRLRIAAATCGLTIKPPTGTGSSMME